MDKSLQKWNNIIKKVQQLADNNSSLKQQINTYKQELTDVKNNLKKTEEDNQSLLTQINIYKQTKGVGIDGLDTVKVKAQIRSYIEEIDEILASINK